MLRVKRRTRFEVGEFLETLGRLVIVAQQSGLQIARKLRRYARFRFPGPGANSFRTLGISGSQLDHSLVEAENIKLIDSKYSNAAWCAPRLANQPIAAAPPGVGEGSVHDLHQLLVSPWK